MVFRDGPAARRARLIGGPDVWEVARALCSARLAEPDLGPTALVELVSGTSGVDPMLIRAAIDYQAASPAQVDGWIGRAEAEAAEAHARWVREQELLGQ